MHELSSSPHPGICKSCNCLNTYVNQDLGEKALIAVGCASTLMIYFFFLVIRRGAAQGQKARKASPTSLQDSLSSPVMLLGWLREENNAH